MKPTYKAVTGTFVVPIPKAPSGGSGTYSASAWVGLDGDTCTSAILQVGLDFTVSGGSVSYDGMFTLAFLLLRRHFTQIWDHRMV